MSEAWERLRQLDSGSLLDDVLAIPDHLRDALWRIESARLRAAEAAGVLVCGMGGSAIGGDLAAAALGDRLTRPLLTVRGYEIPTWVTPEWAVLCSSYSGNTEETLACFEAAGALGARRTVATTGGTIADRAREKDVPVIGLPGVLQPRAAVGYMFTIAAEAVALAGAAEAIHTEIDAAAARLEQRREQLVDQAEGLAQQIGGTIPAFYGADLTAAVARRWKCEVNENAKQPAFWAELPEADHNELAGWDGEACGGMSAIFLGDVDQHPRERRRIELSAALVAEHGAAALTVETEGQTRTERLLGAVMLGDLLSLALAAHNGVDPTPVRVIERLKDQLGRP